MEAKRERAYSEISFSSFVGSFVVPIDNCVDRKIETRDLKGHLTAVRVFKLSANECKLSRWGL